MNEHEADEPSLDGFEEWLKSRISVAVTPEGDIDASDCLVAWLLVTVYRANVAIHGDE